MRPGLVLLLASLLGLAYYKVGAPQVDAYPAPDGRMVIKLSLSRAPGFVAYLRTSGKGKLGAGKSQS